MKASPISAYEFAVFAIVCLVLLPNVSNYGVDGDMMSRNIGQLAISLVTDKDAALDEFVDGAGDGRRDLGDKAFYGGHYYSGMPPGLSWLMAPVYAATMPLVRLSGRIGGEPAAMSHASGLQGRDFVALMFVSSVVGALLTALAAALTFRFVLAVCGNTAASLSAALAWPLCSWFLPYGTQVSTKSAATILIFLAFCAAFVLANAKSAGWRRNAGFAGAGCLAGLSIAVDYIPAAYALILGGYILWRSGWRSSLWYGGAMLPAVIAVAAYHWLVFGNWCSTSYSYRLVPYGTPPSFDWPDWLRVYALSISPYKGMLWYAPWIVVAAWGGLEAGRRFKAETLAVLGVILVTVGVNLCVDVWAGFGWGPRLSMTILPFLALGLAFVPSRAMRLLTFLLALSLVWNATTILTGGVYVDEKPWDIPAVNHVAAMSQHGMASYTLRFLSRHVFPMSALTLTVIETGVIGLTAIAAWQIWRRASRRTTERGSATA